MLVTNDGRWYGALRKLLVMCGTGRPASATLLGMVRGSPPPGPGHVIGSRALSFGELLVWPGLLAPSLGFANADAFFEWLKPLRNFSKNAVGVI